MFYGNRQSFAFPLFVSFYSFTCEICYFLKTWSFLNFSIFSIAFLLYNQNYYGSVTLKRKTFLILFYYVTCSFCLTAFHLFFTYPNLSSISPLFWFHITYFSKQFSFVKFQCYWAIEPGLNFPDHS